MPKEGPNYEATGQDEFTATIPAVLETLLQSCKNTACYYNIHAPPAAANAVWNDCCRDLNNTSTYINDMCSPTTGDA